MLFIWSEVKLAQLPPIKAPAFTIAECCTSGTSTVAFVPSCTCPRCSHGARVWYMSLKSCSVEQSGCHALVPSLCQPYSLKSGTRCWIKLPIANRNLPVVALAFHAGTVWFGKIECNLHPVMKGLCLTDAAMIPAIHEYDKALWELHMYRFNNEEAMVLHESHLSVVEIKYACPCCLSCDFAQSKQLWKWINGPITW